MRVIGFTGAIALIVVGAWAALHCCLPSGTLKNASDVGHRHVVTDHAGKKGGRTVFFMDFGLGRDEPASQTPVPPSPQTSGVQSNPHTP